MSELDFIRTPKVDNVKLVQHPSNNKGVRGTLHLTTTHIIFVDPLGTNKETWILYSHIAEAEKLPLSARGSSIRLKTKTFLSVTLIITRERDCNDVLQTIIQFSNPANIGDLYAYHFNPKEEDLLQTAGWFLYDVSTEFSRMEVPNELWSKTKLNEGYKLCQTYPESFFLPTTATKEIIIGCAQFRSKNRLPVLSYYNKSTKTAICRCAQPLAGLNTRCNEDEEMIQQLIKSTPGSKRLYIVDTRPKINAIANRAQGKGYENVNHYDNVDFNFIGIENIHVMRSSLRKMLEIFDASELTMSAYLQGLEDSGWLKHVRSIIETSSFIARAVNDEKRTVLVHCSDGWDRTAQTCSIAEILLDPYYHTIIGFQILIEKEWLSFGHKFTDRCGLISGDPKETSPIFTQFLESVWQLMNQFPTAFQFNENFLLEIHYHLYSCQFGTFIGNSEMERLSLKLPERTYSLWGHIWRNLTDFVNPTYQSTNGILVPLTSLQNFRFWRSLYNRNHTDIHPREIIVDYISCVNDQNTSLKEHIQYLEERIDKLQLLGISGNKSADFLDCKIKVIGKEGKNICSESLDSKESLDQSDGNSESGSKNDDPIVNMIAEDYEKLDSVSEIIKDIPDFPFEWKSLLNFSNCSCGKLIDSLTRKSHCWKCGQLFCTFCVTRSLKIPGHNSVNTYPVCYLCYKEILK